MKPYVIAAAGGWLAYRSTWAYLFGREPILRARTWEAMRLALDELKTKGGARWQDRAPFRLNEKK